MSDKFASANLTIGQLNAIVKKLGGHDEAIKFLQGNLKVYDPTRNWREQDGVIYLSVISDGATGREWIDRLEDQGHQLDDLTKKVLRWPNFQPTSGVTTEVAILKGMLFSDRYRVTSEIHVEGQKRQLNKPHPEVACLIREVLSDDEIKAMNLSLVLVMHEPIEYGSYGHFLSAGWCAEGNLFRAHGDIFDFRWPERYDFAFSISELVHR